MSNDYRPFSRRDPRSVLEGLMAILRDRGVEAQWHQGTRHNHFMALVGGDGGLEVHAFFGRQRLPKIGRILLIEVVHPAFISPDAAQAVAFCCDRANETLYGSKLYLRRAPGDQSVFQLVVERGCLIGGGDLFRLADEFDLLVTEYSMVEEQMEGVLAEGDPILLANRGGLFDGPVAENC